ncbi:MAG TPA: AzlC family ABC transporter permease [Herpetosiphonaceae bacterium]
MTEFTPSARAEFWAGVRAELPILAGGVPFGLIYAVGAIDAGIPPLQTLAMSSLVFGGSAQVVIAQQVGALTPELVIIVTALIINIRHLLYSASLAPHIAHLRWRWKAGLAYLLTDEAYVVGINRYDQPPPLPANKHWFVLGAGLALWVSWQLSTAAGIFLSSNIPDSWSLDIAFPLTFLALVVPNLKDRPSVAAALSAAIVAVAARGLPLKLGLVAATLVGIGVGVAVESRAAARRAAGAAPQAETEQGRLGES